MNTNTRGYKLLQKATTKTEKKLVEELCEYGSIVAQNINNNLDDDNICEELLNEIVIGRLKEDTDFNPDDLITVAGSLGNNSEGEADTDDRTPFTETSALSKYTSKKGTRLLEEEKISVSKGKHPFIDEICQSCPMKCEEKFDGEQRKKVYNEFWLQSYEDRKIWLNGHVSFNLAKRRLVNCTRKIQYANKYAFFDEYGSPHNVCQNFFLNTLGFTSNSVINSLKKSMLNGTDSDSSSSTVPRNDKTGKLGNKSKLNYELINTHILSYNPLPSHYKKEHAPKRLYLQPELSATSMYNDFAKQYPRDRCSYETYSKQINSMNISFYQANVEVCGTCMNLKNNPSDENAVLLEHHLERAKEARECYNADRLLTNVEVYAGDLLKVSLLPRMPELKECFFTPRLIAFNETFAKMNKRGQHFCILWHEAITGRKKEDVANAFLIFLQQLRDEDNIIIWLDNCNGQNKNFAPFSALICYVNSNLCSTYSITLKYLVPGHTFMAADGIHGHIEQKIRKKCYLYDFDDFVQCVETSTRRTKCVMLSERNQYIINVNIKPRNKRSEDLLPLFQELIEVQLIRGSFEINYKVSFKQTEYNRTENLLKPKCDNELKLRPERMRGIHPDKIAKIIENLVCKMSEERQRFWKNLPVNENAKDLLKDGT